MSIIGWIVLGLLVGIIAKVLMPGRDGGGIILTTLLGVVGAFVGGYLGSLIFNVSLTGFFQIQTWLLAIAGAVLVLLVWRLLFRRRAHR